MLLDLVNQISSERTVERYFGHPSLSALRTSWGRPESTSQGRPLDVRLRRPIDVISGRPQDVRLRRARDVRLRRPRDGQIGSLGDVLGTLEGDVPRRSWGQIFAGWE